ncbi:hypothetical protein V2G26_002321 [Clonostachys chloroleuca]
MAPAAIHPQNPSSAGESELSQSRHPQYDVPHAAAFVRVDAHYESPAGKAGACKPVQVTTQWESARYGTVEEISHSGSDQLVTVDPRRCEWFATAP